MELFQELTMKIHFDFRQAIKKQEKKKIKIPGNLGKGSKRQNNNY